MGGSQPFSWPAGRLRGASVAAGSLMIARSCSCSFWRSCCFWRRRRLHELQANESGAEAEEAEEEVEEAKVCQTIPLWPL